MPRGVFKGFGFCIVTNRMQSLSHNFLTIRSRLHAIVESQLSDRSIPIEQSKILFWNFTFYKIRIFLYYRSSDQRLDGHKSMTTQLYAQNPDLYLSVMALRPLINFSNIVNNFDLWPSLLKKHYLNCSIRSTYCC
jgi:hypothetical protein